MMQPKAQGRTRTGEFHTREKRLMAQQVTESKLSDHKSQVEWIETPRKRPGEQLTRNMAVAASLVLCALALRQGALPGLDGTVDAVITAVTSDTLLDDSLGKLSFVSSLFPEATLVFGEQRAELSMPVSGGMVVHAWSEGEPYISWRSDSDVVTASGAGEVIGVYHGNGHERLVQVLGDDGISCLYGNLGEVSIQTGDAVQAGEVLGTVLQGSDLVLEVRQNGVSVDPALFLR